MGFRNHLVLKCHTCKRRHVSDGPKKGGSYDEAKKKGWILVVQRKLGEYVWLCPTSGRKHASTKLPLV
jgi:hypothetical protein